MCLVDDEERKTALEKKITKPEKDELVKRKTAFEYHAKLGSSLDEVRGDREDLERCLVVDFEERKCVDFFYWAFGDLALDKIRNYGHERWVALHPDMLPIGPMDLVEGWIYMCSKYYEHTGVHLSPSIAEIYCINGQLPQAKQEH